MYYCAVYFIFFTIYSDLKGFESEKEVEEYFRRGLKNNNNEAQGWGAVVFDKGVSQENLADSPEHHTVSYKIRLENTERASKDGDTNELIPSKQQPGPNTGFKTY